MCKLLTQQPAFMLQGHCENPDCGFAHGKHRQLSTTGKELLTICECLACKHGVLVSTGDKEQRPRVSAHELSDVGRRGIQLTEAGSAKLGMPKMLMLPSHEQPLCIAARPPSASAGGMPQQQPHVPFTQRLQQPRQQPRGAGSAAAHPHAAQRQAAEPASQHGSLPASATAHLSAAAAAPAQGAKAGAWTGWQYLGQPAAHAADKAVPPRAARQRPTAAVRQSPAQPPVQRSASPDYTPLNQTAAADLQPGAPCFEPVAAAAAEPVGGSGGWAGQAASKPPQMDRLHSTAAVQQAAEMLPPPLPRPAPQPGSAASDVDALPPHLRNATGPTHLNEHRHAQGKSKTHAAERGCGTAEKGGVQQVPASASSLADAYRQAAAEAAADAAAKAAADAAAKAATPELEAGLPLSAAAGSPAQRAEEVPQNSDHIAGQSAVDGSGAPQRTERLATAVRVTEQVLLMNATICLMVVPPIRQLRARWLM